MQNATATIENVYKSSVHYRELVHGRTSTLGLCMDARSFCTELAVLITIMFLVLKLFSVFFKTNPSFCQFLPKYPKQTSKT